MASSSFLLIAAVACISFQYTLAYPMQEVDVDEEPLFEFVVPEGPQIYDHVRYVRSLQPGAPNFPMPGQGKQEGWKFDPSLTRGEDGNTLGSINIHHTGRNHEVGANWDKVIRGPGKAKPTYSIHGSWRWLMASPSFLLIAAFACIYFQYSLAYPMEEVVVDGEPSFVYVQPEESQIYHQQRYVRSLQPGAPNFPMPGQGKQEGWKFDPSLTRGEDGNTLGSINIHHTGRNHEVGANWDKVIRGPGKAKPTYSIHGSWRCLIHIKRVMERIVKIDNLNQFFSMRLILIDDEDLKKRKEIMASPSFLLFAAFACIYFQYSLAYPMEEVVVDEEPSFVYVHPGESQIYHQQRYVRSLQPGAPNFPMPGQGKQEGWKFDPSLTRGEDGNTLGSINIHHTGPNHEVGANWDKVIRGPGKAKPTYSIHGSWRWKDQVLSASSNSIVVNPALHSMLYFQKMASSSFLLIAAVACISFQYTLAYPMEEVDVDEEPLFEFVVPEGPQIYDHLRYARSLQPGAPNFPMPGQGKQEGWKFDPSLTRGEDGNTLGSINIHQTGRNHEVGANWNKVIRGPGKAKPTYSIRGSWRWDKKPFATTYKTTPFPDRGFYSSLSTLTDKITLPIMPYMNRELNPKKKSSTTNETNIFEMASSSFLLIAAVACISFQYALAYPMQEVDVDEESLFEYVVPEGPQIYDHLRFVRSLQPGAPNFPMPGQEKQEGWKFDPSLTRGEDGNTLGSINIHHTGPNHEVGANWDKVIRGPGKAKPTYSIRGSWRW
ncbi:acaloleptin A-like [Harmonia axyridis]|uniref:acaloleptin A-like n=1 Tax=Harmonia axyridis TaxID=115357 RepID=UPI001E279545|nr:acaloleptin A-like [Harmonia axyridis]